MARSFLFGSFAKVMEFLRTFRYLDLRPGQRVCDLGCGLGVNDALLALTGASVFGVDIDHQVVAEARDNGRKLGIRTNYSVADLSNGLGFKSETFDKAVSYCVLEHLADPEKFLCEVNRVLRPNGILVLSIDSFSGRGTPPEFIGRHRRLCHVHKYYTREEVEHLLQKCSFSVGEATFLLRAPLSSWLFERLLQAYFLSDRRHKACPLAVFKLFAPLTFLLAVLADSFRDDSNGGYWLAVRATKAADDASAGGYVV